MKRVFDGWSMSGIFSTQTGFPTTLLAGGIRVRDLTDRIARHRQDADS